MTVEQKDLYNAIDDILWNDWDPIGVNTYAPRDEYRSYTPAILRLKINSANAEVIADTLHQIETVTIGVLGDSKHCLHVATKICNL
ncbi:hypothetical protein [Fibrella aquatica]|uniref:hypothetical protein n=1 Tax=Fibrella aquatica TaxID=3242487 RepID=UPI003522606F